MPTKSPSKVPTESPTTWPTNNPTNRPTFWPTRTPTQVSHRYLVQRLSPHICRLTSQFPPVALPPCGQNPSKAPTALPTRTPSHPPTAAPTRFPSQRPTGQPTTAPTPYPTDTPTPSPTRLPTTTPTIAPTPGVEYVKLFIVGLRPTATSVDVIVKAAQPCRVFCAAVRDEDVPIPSVTESMVRHSTLGNLEEAHRRVGLYANMTITGLQAMTSYRVHCYSEDWELPPHAMPDWKVRDTYKVVDTGCCAVLSLPAFPKNLRELDPTKPVLIRAPVAGVSVDINVSYCGNLTSSLDCRLPLSQDDCTPDPGQHLLRLNPESFLDLTEVEAAASGRPLGLYAFQAGCFVLSYIMQGPALERGYDGAAARSHGESHLQQVLFFHSHRDPIPAPNITWARFAATGAEVEIGFEYETDRGGIRGIFPCSRLLKFTARSLDSESRLDERDLRAQGVQCRWKTSTILVATIMPTSTLLPGDSVSIAPLRLRAKCTVASAATSDLSSAQACITWPFNAAGSPVEITRPEDPVVPVPLLTYAHELTPCSDLVVDAFASSGSAGRPMLYYWIVHGGTLSNLTTYLDESGVNPQANVTSWARDETYKGTSVLRIPRAMLEPDTTYVVVLYLLNVLGASAVSPPAVIRVKGLGNGTNTASVATVQILPSSVEVYRWQALDLYAEVSVSHCAPVATGVSFLEPPAEHLVIDFAWELAGGDGRVLRSISRDPRYFALPPTALLTGFTYNVTVRANVTLQWTMLALTDGTVQGYKFERIQASRTASIYVRRSAPLLEIRGGDRMIGLNTPLTLDARTSIDPDNVESGTAALNLTWYCIRGASLYGRPCNLPNQPAGPHVEIGLLPALGDYIFTVVAITASPGGQPASTSVTITAVDRPAAPISRVNRHQSLSIYTYKGGTVNPAAKVALVGTVEAPYRMDNMSFFWEIVGGDLATPGLTLTDVATTPVRGDGIAVEAGGVLPWALALPPRSLTPGSAYIFRLVASDGVDSFFAQLDFTTNRPPAYGTVSVTPTEGTALRTRFDVVTSDWLDDPSDYPLKYEFFVDGASCSHVNHTGAVTGRYMLAYRRPQPSLVGALLPASHHTGSVVVSACATDTYNATGCAAWGAAVRIQGLEGWSSELRQDITDVFTAALNTRNVDAAAAAILMALSSIRSSGDRWVSSCGDPSAPDCSPTALVASLLPLLAKISSMRDPTPEGVEQQAAILDLVLGPDRYPLALKLDEGLTALETITAHAAVTGLNGNIVLASRLACAASNLLDEAAGSPESLGKRRRVVFSTVTDLARATWSDTVPTEEALQILCPQMNFTSRATFGSVFGNSSALVMGDTHELAVPTEEAARLLGETAVRAVDELYTSFVVVNSDIHHESTSPLNSPLLRIGLDFIKSSDDTGGRRRLQPLTPSLTMLDLKSIRPNELQVRRCHA
jgi:hypothetical protein